MTMRLLLGGALLALGCADGTEASAAGDIVPTDTIPPAAAVAGRDPDLAVAEADIAAGRAWVATQRLAPRLRDPQRRTPATVLLAARAAAGWHGWDEVERLLAAEPWLDSDFGREGRELLARAALDRGDARAAARHAGAAVQAGSDGPTRGYRLVFLARALDRLDRADSAAQAYAAAAELIPGARDWLLLRAAGVTSDAAARTRHLRAVQTPVATERVPWTEAQALERFGDPAGAAARYAEVGATVTALRLRMRVATEAAARASLRAELLAIVRARPGTADARAAIAVLDSSGATLAPGEELLVARSAAASGQVPRALTAYDRARAAAPLSASDRLQYALTLQRAGRTSQAMTELAAITTPSSVAATAAYQRARLVLSGSGAAAARTSLRQVATRHAADTVTATAALFLLADLWTDERRDAEAQAVYRELYRRYPTSGRADDARFHAAMIDFVQGRHRAAAAGFDSLVALFPRSNELAAARYWSGRAHAAAGDSSAARDRWRRTGDLHRLSYYAVASARRLGTAPWMPTGDADGHASMPVVVSAMRRIVVLERLGLDTEVRLEYDALVAAAQDSAERRLATAEALVAHGQTSRAIPLALRAIERGDSSARTYRLAFPLVGRTELERESRARGVDPALVAALIRQESWFNPAAVSPVGARGLMQLMPPVGQSVARSLAFPVWSPALLLDPGANLQMGIAHLAVLLRQHPDLVRVLAGYNAGNARVARWVTKPGTGDAEVLVERIPYVETRDYVRIVQRNRELYRALYGWRAAN
jgi:soluble lytic murein transglycosylase